MSVVCKMYCHDSPLEPVDQQVQRVRLIAAYESDPVKASENAIFGNATPWGEVVMGIAPLEAKKFFKTGRSYYVTFTEAPN